jgi:hypothetical protein
MHLAAYCTYVSRRLPALAAVQTDTPGLLALCASVLRLASSDDPSEVELSTLRVLNIRVLVEVLHYRYEATIFCPTRVAVRILVKSSHSS